MKIVKDNEVMKKGDYVVGVGFVDGFAEVDGFAGCFPTAILGYERGLTVVVRIGRKEKAPVQALKRFGKLITERYSKLEKEE